MRRVVLDVDTGIDDALALLYAVAHPDVELCGVTTVVGNVPADVAARSSAAVLARAGAADVPIAIGATRTLTGAGPRRGPTNHGPDGLVVCDCRPVPLRRTTTRRPCCAPRPPPVRSPSSRWRP